MVVFHVSTFILQLQQDDPAGCNSLFYLKILDSMGKNQIDQFISGTIGFRSESVQFRQDILFNTHRNNLIPIVTFSLNLQSIISHIVPPPIL